MSYDVAKRNLLMANATDTQTLPINAERRDKQMLHSDGEKSTTTRAVGNKKSSFDFEAGYRYTSYILGEPDTENHTVILSLLHYSG